MIWAAMPHVLGDANDSVLFSSHIRTGQLYLLAYRALIREESLSECLVNNHNALTSALIAFVKIASFEERGLECMEITRRNELHTQSGLMSWFRKRPAR